MSIWLTVSAEQIWWNTNTNIWVRIRAGTQNYVKWIQARMLQD